MKKPIELYYTMPLNTAFDAFEIHPVKNVHDKEDTKKYGAAFEVCEPEEAEMWSIFVHLPGEGLQCIADCKDSHNAELLMKFLENLAENYKPKQEP